MGDFTLIGRSNGRRQFRGEVELSEGSTTLSYSDLPGVRGSFREPPHIFVTGPSGDEAVSSRGSSQATIQGDGDDTVQVQIFENR